MSTSRETWVLLRGLLRSGEHWHGFDRALASALPDVRVLTPTLPGNGRRNGEASPLTIRGYVEALRATLAHEGVEGPVSILAQSLGGMVTMDYALAYPQEVREALLVNTSFRDVSPLHHRFALRSVPEMVRSYAGARDARSRESFLVDLTLNQPADRNAVVEDFTALARAMPVQRRNALRQMIAASRFTVGTVAPRAPVALVVGRGDRLVDPRCSDAIAARFGFPTYEHPTAGHDLAVDVPSWLVDVVTSFRATR